jgi:VWFA-related protein
MMSLRRILPLFSVACLAALALAVASTPARAQNPSTQPANPPVTPPPDQSSPDAGPATDSGPLIIKKKSDADNPPPPPPAPAAPKNPDNQSFSMRVDVPLVNLNVNVILDKTHQFVPGLRANNFLVLEDGVEQKVDTVRVTQTPITAVMLLEFASTSWNHIQDMQQSAVGFYHSLRPDDYVAVITYDLRTHILADFTNNKEVLADSIRSLRIPGFSDTNLFDALYETLDRTSRIDGRKYIILIGSGRDTFSKLTLDDILKKIKATPNVTIFSIGTGALSAEMGGMGLGMRGGGSHIDTLQAQNQLKTFAQMTGGMYFYPMFLGEIPDIFAQINSSIRNQYVVTYRPSNTRNDGSYRHVQVLLVDNEGHPLQMQDEKQKPVKYSVIARDGYRAKLPVE